MADYDRDAIERKWQDRWEELKLYHFNFNSDEPVYSIDNPPRYASGPLHVGHAIHYTHIDFAARYKRQRGYNVMFPLCVDVNGMPIEVNVEKKFNIKMHDTPRQQFIRMCTEFADANIDRICNQFKILGDSMDPSIFYRTDAHYYRRLTQISFIKLYKRGLIYKGLAPVNWCVRCGTALADAEVEYRTRMTNLNFIHFGVESLDEDIIVATTRPELICTCQLAAVNPRDEKKAHLIGKKLITPIYGREVEIVGDDRVDPDFGTGLVMICSIGDKDDLEWIYKYNLTVEKGIDERGSMTELAGAYHRMEVKEAQNAIIEDLRKSGLLQKQEELEQSTGTCWRCHTPIEFLQVPQWFLKTLDAKDDVLRIADELEWKPEFMKVRLENWVNSLNRDWVISRQRYFATPIPLWECNGCGEVVLANEEDCYVDPTADAPPVPACPDCGSALIGCDEVLDTWMDSSISPLFISKWQQDDEQFEKLFPTSLRPQGQDIIRTWAFYTILRSHYLTGKKPWNEIMVDGFILSPDGKPMHASLGNIIDPLDLLEEHGTDAWRYYSGTVPIGEDCAIRTKDIVHGGRFCTKFWNVQNFVSKGVRGGLAVPPEDFHTPDKWILTKYSKLVGEVTSHYEDFRYDRAVKAIEQFTWHELADHYLEMVKHRPVEEDDALAMTLYEIGLGITKMLAPITPHICDEVYEMYYKEFDGAQSVTVSEWPVPSISDPAEEEKGELLKEVIASIRGWKSGRGIPLNQDIGIVEVIGDDLERLIGCEGDIAGTLKARDVLLVGEREIVETPTAVKPVHAKMGPTFKQNAKEVVDTLAKVNPVDIVPALETGHLEIQLKSGEKVVIEKDMVEIVKIPTIDGKEVQMVSVRDLLIIIGE